MISLIQRTLSVFLLFNLVACTTTITQEFRRNPDSVVETSYIATDADFSSYDRLTGAEMGIFFPRDSAIPEEDLTRIRTIFRTAFLGELTNYTVVTEAGPGIMLIEASLIDLRNASYNDIPNLRREVQEVAQPGSMVFLMELKDSDTDRVLGRAVDSSRNPNIGIDQLDESEWQEVEVAASHWAALFRQFLDQNLNN
ncbi:MAG: DUF3313 family protein [Woeseiaceae bacterium]